MRGGGKFAAWLELGRVSNLPTVWSNGLAGWLLADGRHLGNLAATLAALTLFYTGGMFLNDAWDAEWDRRRRSERPIPSGRFSRTATWVWAMGMMGAGLALASWKGAALFGGWLAGMIFLYTAIHKLTPLAVIPMALCRLLAYPLAISPFDPDSWQEPMMPALAGAAFVLNVSLIARREAFGGKPRRGIIAALFVFIALLSLLFGSWSHPWSLAATALFLLWGIHLANGVKKPVPVLIGHLLASIPLLDLTMVAAWSPDRLQPVWIVFPLLFGITLLAQKRVSGS